jgi:hypothetical protein
MYDAKENREEKIFFETTLEEVPTSKRFFHLFEVTTRHTLYSLETNP